MKKILRYLSCFVCAVLCMFSLAACGEKEEVYSNMTRSGFNNYLTDAGTNPMFTNYEVNIVEKIDNDETLKVSLKTRTLGGMSIGIATYNDGGLNVEVYISQDKVYFKFKNSSGTVIENLRRAVTLNFYAKEDLSGKALNVNELKVLKTLYDCLNTVDARTVYDKIKTDTTNLNTDYTIKMLVRDTYNKYKLNYSAYEQEGSFAEEYSVDTYLEFKHNIINKIEYVKSGKQINNSSFNNYELKMTTTIYSNTINFPEELNNTEKYPVS